MKKYLLPDGVNWYRANMHCHSTFSDGHYTPAEIKKLYMEQGYSVVAYTDHEAIFDHSELTDENFVALTSSEYSVTEYRAHPENVEGVDIPAWKMRKTIHLGVYSKDPHNTFHPAADEGSLGWWRSQGKLLDPIDCDGYAREYTVESLNETVKRLNENGFLVSLNHPNWSLMPLQDCLDIKGLWALEILNYATERETGGEYCPYIYDSMVRDDMYKLNCIMGDDNHNGGGSLDHSFGGSTFFGAPELTYESIINAMEKGEFYCASGKNPPRINALYVEDNMIKIDCSEATDIFVTGFGRAYRHVSGENLTHAEFWLDRSDVLFRVTVRDKFGNSAHTHYYKAADYYTAG